MRVTPFSSAASRFFSASSRFLIVRKGRQPIIARNTKPARVISVERESTEER